MRIPVAGAVGSALVLAMIGPIPHSAAVQKLPAYGPVSLFSGLSIPEAGTLPLGRQPRIPTSARDDEQLHRWDACGLDGTGRVWGERSDVGQVPALATDGEATQGEAWARSGDQKVDELIRARAARPGDKRLQANPSSQDAADVPWTEVLPEILVTAEGGEGHDARTTGPDTDGRVSRPSGGGHLALLGGEQTQQDRSSGPAALAPGSSLSPARVSTATFSLDGVQLELGTAFLRDLTFRASDPNTAIQVATALEREPIFRELSITAVPFGVEPPTESLPRSERGGAETYRAMLRGYRQDQDGNPADGPAAQLFGKEVAGSTSVVDLHVSGEELSPVAITEWVAEAGNRIWIVRASQELAGGPVPLQLTSTAQLLSETVLRSKGFQETSTSLAAKDRRSPITGIDPQSDVAQESAASDLPSPSWWSGECDANNYYAATGVQAYPLGAEYRGVQACGPRPWADAAPEALVDFGVGVGQYEWQCPELSMRFLYLAYGIAPYSAHGSQVVWNYHGDVLDAVPNCETGQAPGPDDVLSYGSTSTYGHTSVVAASDVDEYGNGTITVIEQNSSSTGLNTIEVFDWCVEPSYGSVSGWLHGPPDEPHSKWLVGCYRDEQLVDECAGFYQGGAYVFGDWGDEAPASGCPADHFSTRFSRAVFFAGGEYRFGLGYDDGARLKVDGETVIDGWETSRQHYARRDLESGYHDVSVEHREEAGDAYLTAFWSGPGYALAREPRDSYRWHAQYWGNEELWWDPIVQVNQGSGFLDRDWGESGPTDGLPVDHFSSRFERAVSFEPGLWRFVVSADDGVRFWVDDDLTVDGWQDQSSTFRPEVELGQGDHELRIEHYDNNGPAMVRLSWEWVPDATTLTARITSPAENAVIGSCPVTIEAEATDDASGVSLVEFHAAYDDGWHHLGDDDEGPYRRKWDCSSLADQGIWLTIHVWDNAGNEIVDPGGHVYVKLRSLQFVHLPVVLVGQ